MTSEYSHLTHIKSLSDLALYELIPTIVWIFDIDRHGWWWGNEAAIKFWRLENLEQLVNKDLSDDTQGARDRTLQTFELAAKNGLTNDPWTTYPNGKPKTLYMMHRAVLIGPDRHRGIIAYINEEVNLGEQPENLLLAEAMRYTTVLITSFTLDGDVLVENPAATEAYNHIANHHLADDVCAFTARFVDLEQGKACMQLAQQEKGGRWTHLMRTRKGQRLHTLDIRMTRHPLNGDSLFLVAEYDVTPLHEALNETQLARDELHKLAHYDSLTGLPSLRLLQQSFSTLIGQADRHNHKIAVLFIDLDGFKIINDTWGHNAGDIVLKTIASRLTNSLRQCDQVVRVGGDEFVALLSDIKQYDDIEHVARKLITELNIPICINDAEPEVLAQLGASIGIAVYPEHGSQMDVLLKAADDSMYKVKHQGKNNFIIAEKN
jgi:diguanylate cyclase (GGDEF)-like protein